MEDTIPLLLFIPLYGKLSPRAGHSVGLHYLCQYCTVARPTSMPTTD